MDNNRNLYNFIPDIVSILCAYELTEYLSEYVSEGVTTSNSRWKSIVHKAKDDLQLNDWRNRISGDPNFNHFASMHKTVSIASFWKKYKVI